MRGVCWMPMLAVAAVSSDPIALDLTDPGRTDVTTAVTVDAEYSPLFGAGDVDDVAFLLVADGTTNTLTTASQDGTYSWSLIRPGDYSLQLAFFTDGTEVAERRTLSYSWHRDLAEPEISATLAYSTCVYDRAEHTPGVVVMDAGIEPDLGVEPFAPGDVDGDGLLSTNDVARITRYIAYQKLTEAMKEKFPSYNLEGAARTAADVNGDGVVDAADSAALEARINGGYVLVEGRDYTVAYADNVSAGTGRVTVTGRGGYVGMRELTFSIKKAVLGVDAEPGSGTPPDGGLSRYDVSGVYDGEGFCIDTNGIAAIRVDGRAPTVSYSVDGETWRHEPFLVSEAGIYTFWYRLEAANYEIYTHPVRLTVEPKSLTDESVHMALSCTFYEYDGEPKTPELTVSDEAIALEPVVAPYAPGDVDGDGLLTEGDVSILDSYLAYLSLDDDLKPLFEEFNLTGAAGEAADVTRDGVVDEADLDALLARFNALTEGVDYRVEYRNNVDGNPARVVVTGMGNYGGEQVLTFTIGGVFSEGEILAMPYDGVYDGQDHAVRVAVPDFATVTYADSPEGDWRHEPPAYRDVVATSTWYCVAAPGYLTVTGQVALAIAARPLTVRATGRTIVYGDTVDYGDVVYEGFAPGEDVSLVEGDVSFATADGRTVHDAGGYSILPGGLRAPNYALQYEAGILTVQRRPLTLTAGSASRPYNGTALTCGVVTADGFVPGEGAVYVCAGAQTDAGTSANEIAEVVWNAGTKAANYALTKQAGTLTVTRSENEIVVTADSETWVYDGAVHRKESWTAAGEESLTAGDRIVATFDPASAVSNVSEGTVGNRIAALRVLRGERDVTANYWLTAKDGRLAVKPRSVLLVSADAEKVYDGEPLTASSYVVTGDGFVGTDGVTCSFTGAQTDAGTGANAFSYALNAGVDAANYVLSTKAGTLKVSPRDLAEIAEDDWGLEPGTALVYDGTEQTYVPAAVTFRGLQVTGTWTGNVARDAGSYDMTLTGRGNYCGQRTVGWSIARRAITLTSPTKAKSFDGTPLTFTGAEIEVSGLGYAPNEAFEFEKIAEILDFGTQPATFTVVQLEDKLLNYDITFVHGTLTVTRNTTPVTVTAGSGTWVYDGLAHSNVTFTVQGVEMLGEGETLDVAFAEEVRVIRPDEGVGHDGCVVNQIASVRVLRGEKDITSNYTLVAVPGRLQVTARPVTVSVSGRRVQAVFDGEEKTAEGYGLATDDDLYDVASAVAFSGTAHAARTLVGRSDMELTAEQFTNSDPCFSVAFDVVDGFVEIDPADIAQGEEGDFVAEPTRTAVYDGQGHSAGFVSVTYKGLPVTYELFGTCETNAGSYSVELVGVGQFTGTNRLAWTIAPRPITLSVPSKTKPHDGEPLTYEAADVVVAGDGYVAGERFAYSDFASLTHVGQIPAYFAYGDSDTARVANYDVTVLDGRTLTVTEPVLELGETHAEAAEMTLVVKGRGTWTIHYTLDGTEPTMDSPAAEDGVVVVEGRGPKTVKYAAFDETGAKTETGTFEIAAPILTVTPESGSVISQALEVAMAADIPGAVIYYTLDGSEPTMDSARYEPGLTIEHRCQVKAMAVVEGVPWSETVVVEYSKGIAPPPVIEPGNGATFTTTVQYVGVSSDIADAEIRYTLDGTEPTGESALYDAPVKISGTATVKARVLHPDYDASPVACATIVRQKGLGDTMNAPDVQFSNRSAHPWVVDTAESHDGVESFRSGAIADEETTTLQASVSGAGRVLFWWKASCELDVDNHNWDHVVFKVDRVERARLDGQTAWQMVDLEIAGEGPHVLQWQYVKDDMQADGEDCAWVDQMTWISADGRGTTQLTDVPVPYQWLYEKGCLAEGTPEEAVCRPTGKTGASGEVLTPVDDYVAGTDPRDATDVLRALIELKDGKPTISWTPDLNEGGQKHLRDYTVYGRENLDRGTWQTPVSSAHRFFKVKVSLPSRQAE